MEHALLWVEPQIHLAQASEGLLQVLNQGSRRWRLYHDVVDVGFSVSPELLTQGDVHQPLEGRPSVA